MAEPTAPRESLPDILKIEDRGRGECRASLEGFWGETDAGDLLGRATLAASARGGEDPVAAHALFLAQAPPDVPLSFAREPLGAERRRVRVTHGRDLLSEITFRFCEPRTGLTYQSIVPAADLPAPEDLPSEVEVAEAEGWTRFAIGPIESRRIGLQSPVTAGEPAVWIGWLRPRAVLPDDPHLHAAALAFVSAYRWHWALERRLGAEFPRTELKLLDHTLWVHRDERWDDWWLVKTLSDVGAGGRCLSRREIYTRAGALVASAAWEAATRPRDGS